MVTGARQKDPTLLLLMEGDRIKINEFHKRKKRQDKGKDVV